jgi:hypothetical protein
MGFVPDPEPEPAIVGWCQPALGTVKGKHHRCIECQPSKPAGGHWEALVVSRLAAREKCTVCGRKLEDCRQGGGGGE